MDHSSIKLFILGRKARVAILISDKIASEQGKLPKIKRNKYGDEGPFIEKT